MAMGTKIDLLTSATPTVTDVSALTVTMNRNDTYNGTTQVPTPVATGTNFSWVKTFQMEISSTGSLSMTALMVGKVANETVTGTKLWHYTGHAVGAYVQASAAPTATSDNNVTAPTINSGTATAVPLISAPPSAYGAGPFSATGRVGNLVEVVMGIDATNTTAGGAVALPTLRWSWTEG